MAIAVAVPGTHDRFLTADLANSGPLALSAPVLTLEGKRVTCALTNVTRTGSHALPHGATETRCSGQLAEMPAVTMSVIVRQRVGSSFVRFRYELSSESPCRVSAGAGGNAEYLRIAIPPAARLMAVRLSEFEESVHSYHLTEQAIRPEAFTCGLDEMGPILAVESGGRTALVAYEHGSDASNPFLTFRFGECTGVRFAQLQAVKGNVPSGTDISKMPLQTVWFQVGVVEGGLDACAAAYRGFVLSDMSQNVVSRSPLIFYNTWNYQERNKWWNHRTFLDSMRQDRIAQEIDIAGRLGIDVFVLDTGWYAKTGEWAVNTARFDAKLATVRKMLDERGMKLGLWFSPTESAVSAQVTQRHLDCRCETDGKPWKAHPVWETEESVAMCLVSRWWESFADELIRLHRELGVTYFKWDAIGQFGCDSPNHHHGTVDNTPLERKECAAFEQVRYMARIVDKVCAACPAAIVDFDVTESGRSVGLAFLASGKFFLINNGPYYQNLDDPQYAPGGGMGANVFVFPGKARPRNCRETLDYDRWIPSILFLAHYLPDDPAASQETNIASLILGHNGIWGNLVDLSDEGVARYGKWLGHYRRVRDAITSASPIVTGVIGGTPEIHEKIAPVDGRGAVSIFAPCPGRYTYVTHRPVAASHAAMDGIEVARLPSGQARITVTLNQGGGKAVFFGTE